MLAGVRRDQKTSADRVRLRPNQGGADRFRGEGGEGSERSVHSGRLRVESKSTIGDHAMSPTVTSAERRETKLDGSKTDGPKAAGLYAALICSHEPLSLGRPGPYPSLLDHWTGPILDVPIAMLTPLFPGTHLAGPNSACTTAPPHVRACSTGNSERLCPPIRFRCQGPPSSLLQLICEQGACSCTHPKTFPLLHSILRRVASFRAKRISCMFPSSTIIANSLVQSLHDPNQLPDGSVEKPLLPLVPWHPFGPSRLPRY
jgi:hypothetical protein